MNNGNNKGSIWRIWDLHIHSPATYGGDYTAFINNAKNSIASVIGINDYCTLKGYSEVVKLGGVPDKVIFPVVEFRMHNIVANRKNADLTKAGTKINFHIIFNNDPSVFSSITTWLNSLECFNEKGETIQLGVATDLMKVSFDFVNLISCLKKLKLYDDHCLIWLPYDEYGGIDDIDPNDNFFKLSLIKQSHIIGSSTKKQIDFFKWQDPKYTREEYRAWFDLPKPCIKGSDAKKIEYSFGHLQNDKSQPIDKYCWIKADTTFNGLKQILVEPDRVFIGDEPDLLKRVRANQTKFIKSLSIKKIAGASVDDVWFDNFYIEFNSGLVAIIGNKGGGKSAITDVISLCGNTYQDPSHFSFLNKDKFRKPKPCNLSESFEATLIWEDGTPAPKILSENPDKKLPEKVKYIPQNFLEHLCNNVESEAFEKELKQIIYSHTPPAERLGKASLDELINYKSSLVTDEITQIQGDISKLNLEIVTLENKATEDFKKSIENKLQLKKGEITAHLSIKPKRPEAGQESGNSKIFVAKLTELREQIKTLEEEILEHRKNKLALSIKSEELNRAIQFYKNLDEQLKKNIDTNNEFIKILTKHSISTSDVFSYSINTEPISKVAEIVIQKISDIALLLDIENTQSKTHQLQKLNEQLQQSQEMLDKPAKEQQKYLDDLKKWEEQKQSIEGNNDMEGSLKYFESQLNYLSTQLSSELTAKLTDRKKLVEQLYSKILSLIEIRKKLFQPVTTFINDFKELKEKYDVKIDVALELRSFPDNFFAFISQGRSGTFNGKEEGYKKLLDLIEKAHFESVEGFIAFTDEIIDNLTHDKRVTNNPTVEIKNQLKAGKELNQLYDFIFHYGFLQPVYNLKLGNKTLQELSPGERGALLLIFYLILDKDDIPLVIDQPEENLDNESVYHILVYFIKKVKEQRQIIIVTHNPNLAIVCDADQIIHMKIEKENKNTVKFYSGAIEDNIINKASLNILEGTLPAFNNRDSKYIR